MHEGACWTVDMYSKYDTQSQTTTTLARTLAIGKKSTEDRAGYWKGLPLVVLNESAFVINSILGLKTTLRTHISNTQNLRQIQDRHVLGSLATVLIQPAPTCGRHFTYGLHAPYTWIPFLTRRPCYG